MSYEEHIKLMEKANREYYNYHESILLAKQIIEKQKKAHYAGKQLVSKRKTIFFSIPQEVSHDRRKK
ncbi:hypothetical protein [Enterococcus raffinosus]|uniref:Uncharacterized protein n=3 Tax=Enterococcus TaxID=1350 RepID=A0AAW8TC31_9ENTE|nr:hypothetical protein [Enterococcus raffinosus]MDT2525874.1 hypothetical protein [Enterococcus raffinosus]MDT2536330.1 hypothetical protein [Enterococcus raffinosus]MDT2545351.1 hypothetical protein [Enterococcus raffinosus]MDT2553087.1 hypothetical protein [Enterococcus raffinosus]MDT2580258.1 hypothetical protein [Enterococcus raffinosus]